MTVGSEEENRVEEESTQEAGGSETPEDRKVRKKATKPPRHLSVMRHCMSSTRLAGTPELEQERIGLTSPIEGTGFLPVFRSGSCSDQGNKAYMEDQHICIDNLLVHLGAGADFPSPGAFYGVFDGHDGSDAASFIRDNILKFTIEDSNLPVSVEKALKSAFVRADHALADANSQSGTTALTALIFGRKLHVANAGDCRAVLGKRGRAIELSRDHKPNCITEKLRIEKLGGIVFDGYLNYSNSQLSVARALGDWHMKGPKGSLGPLSAEPELQETILTEEDEFLIIGCDGLWDVMSSQCAVTMVRKELMIHNDPERCSQELVQEALKRNSLDNLTVVVVCFSSDPPPRIEIPRFRVRRSISAEGLNFLKGLLDGN